MHAEWDIVVIGGGIHGVGVAQAAAAAGYRVLLLEKQALAAGTSSRSSKLIHGGLRYLEQGSLKLVWESVRERELLLRLAPGLVHRRTFLVPLYRQSQRRPWYVSSGLLAYALLAGGRRGTAFQRIPRDQWSELDGLTTEGLQAVLAYTDAQTDDIQLTRAVMQSAISLGAEWYCPAEFEHGELTHDECGLTLTYENASRCIRARAVVNAAGPWANHVLAKFQPTQDSVPVELVQGTHIEVPGSLVRGCYYCEAPSDRRAVFVMPWHDHLLIGTTEHPFAGDPEDVRPLAEEMEYLQRTYRHYFPGGSIEILSSWTGLRVLPRGEKSTFFSRSRETMLHRDIKARPRLVSIFGGKLTTYRATAERVVRCLRPVLPRRQRRAETWQLPLTVAGATVDL